MKLLVVSAVLAASTARASPALGTDNNYASPVFDKETARFDRRDEDVPYGMNSLEVDSSFGPNSRAKPMNYRPPRRHDDDDDDDDDEDREERRERYEAERRRRGPEEQARDMRMAYNMGDAKSMQHHHHHHHNHHNGPPPPMEGSWGMGGGRGFMSADSSYLDAELAQMHQSGSLGNASEPAMEDGVKEVQSEIKPMLGQSGPNQSEANGHEHGNEHNREGEQRPHRNHQLRGNSDHGRGREGAENNAVHEFMNSMMNGGSMGMMPGGMLGGGNSMLGGGRSMVGDRNGYGMNGGRMGGMPSYGGMPGGNVVGRVSGPGFNGPTYAGSGNSFNRGGYNSGIRPF